MKKVLIFPFSKKSLAVLENNDIIQNLEIISLVKLKGWGFDELTCYPAGDKLIDVTDDFCEALNKCDTVWFVDTVIPISFEKYIFPKIKQSIEKNKSILISISFSNNQKNKIMSLQKSNSNIKFLGNEYNVVPMKHTVESETPVIAVAGITPNSDKFRIQINLKREFENKGYKVLWISSRKEASVLGGYPIPEIMFSNELYETEKVLYFNTFVTTLENMVTPDIIIIGIPGCIFSFDDKYYSDYGILAFEIFQSILIDKLVVCSPCLQFTSYNIKEIESKIVNRFSTPIIAYHIAPIALDFELMIAREAASYIFLDEDFVNNEIKQIGLEEVQNFRTNKNIERLCQSFINEYSSYT